METSLRRLQIATVGLADGVPDGDADGAEKRSEALTLSVAVEHLKRRRRKEEREQYKQVALTRPGTLCPPPCDFCFLLSQFQLFSMPARAPAAETSKLERTLSDLVNQTYALTPAEVALLWQTAAPRITCAALSTCARPKANSYQ
jgi:hypothetical protein